MQLLRGQLIPACLCRRTSPGLIDSCLWLRAHLRIFVSFFLLETFRVPFSGIRRKKEALLLRLLHTGPNLGWVDFFRISSVSFHKSECSSPSTGFPATIYPINMNFALSILQMGLRLSWAVSSTECRRAEGDSKTRFLPHHSDLCLYWFSHVPSCAKYRPWPKM